MPATSKAEASTKLPVDKGGPEKDTPAKKEFSAKQLVLGLLFGLIFGFLLQKGGVAKYHILLGVLLLEDFTVVKVMLTAIIVGCIGIFSLHALGLVKLHVKPTRYAANIIGGLIFGVGFAIDRLLPGNGSGGARPGKLGCDCGHCRTHARLVPVCRSIRLAGQDADEGRGSRQAHAAGGGWSEPAGVPHDFSAAVDCGSLRDRPICGPMSRTTTSIAAGAAAHG